MKLICILKVLDPNNYIEIFEIDDYWNIIQLFEGKVIKAMQTDYRERKVMQIKIKDEQTLIVEIL